MEEKIKALQEKFPAELWIADWNAVHLPLRFCPISVGSPNYALYASNDGSNSLRIYIDDIEKHYYPTKKAALLEIKRVMTQRLGSVEEYLKKENE